MNTRRTCALVAYGIIALALGACATPYQPASVESREVARPGAQLPDSNNGCRDRECTNAGDIANRVPQQNVALGRAEYFEAEAARRSDTLAQVDATLSAAEYYVQADQAPRAMELIRELDRRYTLDGVHQVQRDRIDVIYAYHAYSNQDYPQALSILQRLLPTAPSVEYVDPRTLPEYQARLELQQQDPEALSENDFASGPTVGTSIETQDRQVIEQPRLVPTPALSAQQIDALLLGSFCYREMGQFDQQIDLLMQREAGLRGEARAQSTRYTWQVINALPELSREQIIAQSSLARIKPRLEQSLSSRTATVVSTAKQFTSHPNDLISQHGMLPSVERQAVDWTSKAVRQVAVLLPLSSKFNKAATALLDGIKHEHELQRGAYSPELLVYDIGDDPYQTQQFYQAAVNQGAEFIIGPLGKDYADQLLLARSQYAMRNAPALLLGGSSALDVGTHRLEFSPEREGVMVARKAFADGHLSAAVVAGNDLKSTRIKQAFTQEWFSLGGRVSAQTEFSAAQFDHTVELKLLFQVGASENRAQRLSKVLGYQPEHAAYQRADMDFVFMIADAQTGRLLRPQINYFSASRIPVYAGLDVYTGVADAINDMDLENTLFPVMPWVLRSENVSPYAGQLNQLFALGADSYRVVSQYDSSTQTLELGNNRVIEGYTGLLRLLADGNIESAPLWATFTDGLANVEDRQGFDLTRLSNDSNSISDHSRREYRGPASNNSNEDSPPPIDPEQKPNFQRSF